jgi:hypothetical protein
VLVVVAIALAAQGALMAHLSRTNLVTPGKLSAKLATFPHELGDWVGVDQPIEESVLYGDDHLQRLYEHRITKQPLMVWMIYSSKGKDREHHPEVCMMARGMPEDPAGRQKVETPGHERPVQRYCYGHAGEKQHVYYWHYRLPSKNAETLNLLQRTYHDMQHPPASLTIEIFAPQRGPETETGAKEFMLATDAALQSLVGQGAVRGSDRKPVSLTITQPSDAPPKH